jgi:chromodomain-helicase-DNA-binding protein 4
MTGVSVLSRNMLFMHFYVYSQTPLNNNIRELFNLMNFLDPNEWDDLEQLEKDHEELTEDLVKELHNRLRPYFLRRLKGQVLQLPPKVCCWYNAKARLTLGS